MLSFFFAWFLSKVYTKNFEHGLAKEGCNYNLYGVGHLNLAAFLYPPPGSHLKGDSL